jgi:hypothetical protein
MTAGAASAVQLAAEFNVGARRMRILFDRRYVHENLGMNKESQRENQDSHLRVSAIESISSPAKSGRSGSGTPSQSHDEVVSLRGPDIAPSMFFSGSNISRRTGSKRGALS